jgi:Uncharacterized conserved protein
MELDTLQGPLNLRLGLATENEIAELFDDCEIGAIPPVGAAYGLAVIIDESVAHLAEVYSKVVIMRPWFASPGCFPEIDEGCASIPLQPPRIAGKLGLSQGDGSYGLSCLARF